VTPVSVFGEFQYPQLQSSDYSLGTVGDTELGRYVLDVALDGTPANEQFFSDLAVAEPLLDEPQNLYLASRKRLDENPDPGMTPLRAPAARR
jgi:hypothetical protein